MKIEFLGTGAAWPLPRLNCHCELCSSKDPRDKRKRSSVLVNEKLLLDAGYDAYEQLKDKDLEKLKAVAITHEHPDHLAGLPDLDHIYNRSGTLTLYINKKTWRKVDNVFQWRKVITFIEPFEEYKVDGLIFSFLPVIHTDSAFGILVNERGTRFFYAPDMAGLPEETRSLLQEVDLIAFDGSSAAKKDSTKGHQSMEKGVQLAKGLEAKRAYFTHIGHLTLPHASQEAKFGDRNFKLAHDGLEISL